jgi:hypothetical protein
VHTESPEYFTNVLRRDFEKWGKVARDIGSSRGENWKENPLFI